MEYAVVVAGILRERFRELQQGAADSGIGDHFLAALRAATVRMRTDPLAFGEILYRTPGTHWPVHLAVVAPLAIVFTIHEAGRQVWVVNAHVLSGSRP